MSRDYKSPNPPKSTKETGGSLIWGIFIGYALGLVTAIGVWMYLNQATSPFLPGEKAKSAQETETSPGHVTKAPALITLQDKQNPVEEKPRFDFYKILPGIEEPTSVKESKPAEKQTGPTLNAYSNENKSSSPVAVAPTLPAPQPSNVQSAEKYYLQVGSFKKNDEAENLKAKLALLGVIASVQPIDLAERGIWHRVRVGPYTKKNEIDAVRASLKENSIETQLIRTQ
ncbi:MAG: SPOR domain-containing protein [Pseudomonadota bacterium]